MTPKQKMLIDPCEWNPVEGRPAQTDKDTHAAADYIVDADGQWRLCVECARLPVFRRFRVRKKILIPKRWGNWP